MSPDSADTQSLLTIANSLTRIADYLERSEEQAKSANNSAAVIPSGSGYTGVLRGIRDTAAAMFAIAGISDADERIQTQFFTTTLRNFKYLTYVGYENGANIYAKTEKTDQLPGIFIRKLVNTGRMFARDFWFDSREFEKLFIHLWGGKKQFVAGYTRYLEYASKAGSQ